MSCKEEIIAAGGQLAPWRKSAQEKKKKKRAGSPSWEMERERVFMVSVKHLDATCLKFLDSSFA